MELTATQWILAAFSFVLGTIVALILDEFLRKRDVPTIPRGLMDALAFVGISMLAAGMLVAPLGEVLGIRPPAPAPAPTPTPGPAPANVGYVMATVKDKFATTTTYLSGVTVGLYLTPPSPGQPSYAIQTKQTGTNGSVFFEVPGLTSGTVYLMASMDGYYSDVKSTTIPGPQVYPPEFLWAKFELAKVGTLGVLVENLTPDIIIDPEESAIFLPMTNEEQRLKVTLRNTTKGSGIKDLVIQLTRGAAWRQNRPVVDIDVSAPAGVTVSVEGNLNTNYVQTIKLSGFLTSTSRVEITVSVTLGAETLVEGDLVHVVVDDLGQVDGVGYAGEEGIEPVSCTVIVTSV